MTFCNLKKDEKTFNFVNKYIYWYKEKNNLDFLELDSKLQIKEIIDYLKINNYENKNDEIIIWINNNSKNFRIYLNTLKIVFTIWYCSGHDNLIDWKTFCFIIDRVNNIKNYCLDEILIDKN